jgi:hypothetical protein
MTGENMSNYRMFVQTPSGAKFRAEGEVSEVREDAERFYKLFAHLPAATATASAEGESPLNGNGHQLELPPALAPAPAPAGEGLDQVTLSRLFSKDQHGTVSLRALPHGDKSEADALVALIYGSAVMANEPQVTGSRLMKAAVQSGLHQVDRIDRSLASEIGKHVTTAGFKKGRRYGLTNPGIRRAEEILTGILG